MNKTQVAIFLEILDLEYLKPILIDRFHNIDDLASVNLQEIGIENINDLNKLRYALDEIQQNKTSLEQFDPILSVDESNQLLTRIENETNLMSSSLNLLFNNQEQMNLPRDNATSDIDYSLYKNRIEHIQNDVEQFEMNANRLIECIQRQYPNIKDKQYQSQPDQYYSKKIVKRTLILLTVSIVSIGLMLYIKRK